jgi:PAS domain S-box-containing protein
MLGYKKSEIIGRPLSDFFTGESKKLLETDFPKLKKKKSLKNLARSFVRKDGTTFPVILNVFADYNENGELVQTRAIARDISDLKKAERELKKANRMLKALSECNNALLHINEEKELLNEICRIVVDTGGYRMAWVGIIGSHKDREVKSAAYYGFNDKYISMITSDWTGSGSDNSPPWEAIESGRTCRARDINSSSKSGWWCSEAAKRGFSSMLSVPLYREVAVAGVLNIYSNEVDAFNEEETALLESLAENLSYGLNVLRSNMEKEVARAEALRASHLASIGELAAGVAHEINNPINGIINYAQILANKGKEDSPEFDIFKRIIRESDRIAGIVRNLLSFARERDDSKVPTNICEVLTATIALTEARIAKDSIKLCLDIPRLAPTIIAQPQHLEQVFLNIINNSRYALNQKYAGEHDNKILKIGINTRIADKKQYLRILFYDSGIGIPQGIINKILNPFFSTKPSNVGTGLGLSISHGIVSDHGGNLLIESAEGEYTRVIVELPICIKSRNEALDKVTIA